MFQMVIYLKFHRIICIVLEELVISLIGVSGLIDGAATTHGKEQTSGQNDSDNEFEHGVSPLYSKIFQR